MDLSKVSELELERELESRRTLKKPSATPIHNHMFDRVYNEAINIVDDTEVHGKVSKDAEEGIYEAVMEAVFGDKVWEWIDEKEAK